MKGETFLVACAILALTLSTLMVGVSLARSLTDPQALINWPWIIGYSLSGLGIAAAAMTFRRSSRASADKVLNLVVLGLGAWIVFLVIYKAATGATAMSWPQVFVHVLATLGVIAFTLAARTANMRPLRKWLVIIAAAGLCWTIDTVIALTLFELHSTNPLRWFYPLGGILLILTSIVGFFATTKRSQHRFNRMQSRRRTKKEIRQRRRNDLNRRRVL